MDAGSSFRRRMHGGEPLFTPGEMGVADRAAAAMGVPGLVLMEAAGRVVARAAVRMGVARTLVLCGPGGNGGDGFVAARVLAQLGWPVAVAVWGEVRAGSDAAAMRGRWRGPVVPFEVVEVRRAGLVVDAVFGAGMRGEVPDAVAEGLAAAGRVLAVDVPSGLDGRTGQARGRVRGVDRTVTFAGLKPGHLVLPGRALCGVVEVGDIGMPRGALPGVLAWRNGPGLWRLPRVGAQSHKYIRGHVTVVGGAAMTGAARLAAGAARRVGAGLVTVASGGCGDLYRGGEAGLIVDDAPLAVQVADGRRNAWVCGPGLGVEAAATALPVLIGGGRMVVADADALGMAAGAPERLLGASVATPHGGEFVKVFGPIGEDRIAAVRAAAVQIGGVVVLKGADTVVAGPDGRVVVNDNAPPWLATAGAGDVLSGVIGGLLAQGMPAWEAACAGVWLHGAAGGMAGEGLIAEDLLQWLGAAAKASEVRYGEG